MRAAVSYQRQFIDGVLTVFTANYFPVFEQQMARWVAVWPQ